MGQKPSTQIIILPPAYFWCLVNVPSWEIGDITYDNPAYNGNYSLSALSLLVHLVVFITHVKLNKFFII